MSYTVGVQNSLTRGERELCISPFKKSSNPILSSVPKRESNATIELGRQGNRWICVDRSMSDTMRIRRQHSPQWTRLLNHYHVTAKSIVFVTRFTRKVIKEVMSFVNQQLDKQIIKMFLWYLRCNSSFHL